MRLEGIHHVTAITADAPGNVDFYARLLGLRLVKKTVNQDDPTVYHLFYADERGDPGSDITFFEYPGARQGRAGAGMVHTVRWRVASGDAVDFWEKRLENHVLSREGDRLTFVDPEGLRHELGVIETTDDPLIAEVPDDPLIADHPEIPRELALQGFEGVRAYERAAEAGTAPFLEQLGFEHDGRRFETRGETRGGWIQYESAPEAHGIPGAGTVHHVAWASTMEDEEAWQKRVAEAGARPTPVIDRFWFLSIYFREPNGVLFEIATLGPGFAADEDPEHLGEKLVLPPAFEHMRSEVEPILTPLPLLRTGHTPAAR